MFASGVRLYSAGQYAEALSMFGASPLASTPLADYATYYVGLTQLALGRAEEARHAFEALGTRVPEGYLSEVAPVREAEAAEAQGDHVAALRIYERLAAQTSGAPEEMLSRVARAAQAAGDRPRATAALLRLYVEFPLHDRSLWAGQQLEQMGAMPSWGATYARYTLELDRSERLFAAKRYTQARGGFEELRSHAPDADRDRIALRLAQCDLSLRRYRTARDRARLLLDRQARRAEVAFVYLSATRALGQHDEFVRLARRLVDEFPGTPWAEETLNSLARHYMLVDEPARADEAFRELRARFPAGRFAERAAWKIGWWAYKHGRYQESIQVFEEAAARFLRSDYRPSYVYWAARAHDRLGNRSSAATGHTRAATDYRNSYYGRLSLTLLGGREPRLARGGSGESAADRPVEANSRARAPASGEAGMSPSAHPPELGLPPTEAQIRLLLSLELYDLAMDELLYAQRVRRNSPAIEATIGWVHYKQRDFRRGIAAMKRAYPRYFAAGESLPAELLRVLFPLDYWEPIRRHAVARNLDPFMIAALVAQESTFVPDIRSSANAIGLMQILPSSGRRYARALRLGRFSISMLTTPETNIRLGTAYLSDLIERFGEVHLALASYNAGEHRVTRWLAERPGLERDEFIDDIPFPETQNYVKKILGTTEDYRRLYGGEAMADAVASHVSHSRMAGRESTVHRASAKNAAAEKRSSASKATKGSTGTQKKKR